MSTESVDRTRHMNAFERLCCRCRDGDVIAIQVAYDMLSTLEPREFHVLADAVAQGTRVSLGLDA